MGFEPWKFFQLLPTQNSNLFFFTFCLFFLRARLFLSKSSWRRCNIVGVIFPIVFLFLLWYSAKFVGHWVLNCVELKWCLRKQNCDNRHNGKPSCLLIEGSGYLICVVRIFKKVSIYCLGVLRLVNFKNGSLSGSFPIKPQLD